MGAVAGSYPSSIPLPSINSNCRRWQFWYEDIKEQIRKLAQALGRFMHRALSRGFQTWIAWYDEVKKQQRLLGGYTIPLINPVISTD